MLPCSFPSPHVSTLPRHVRTYDVHNHFGCQSRAEDRATLMRAYRAPLSFDLWSRCTCTFGHRVVFSNTPVTLCSCVFSLSVCVCLSLSLSHTHTRSAHIPFILPCRLSFVRPSPRSVRRIAEKEPLGHTIRYSSLTPYGVCIISPSTLDGLGRSPPPVFRFFCPLRVPLALYSSFFPHAFSRHSARPHRNCRRCDKAGLSICTNATQKRKMSERILCWIHLKGEDGNVYI